MKVPAKPHKRHKLIRRLFGYTLQEYLDYGRACYQEGHLDGRLAARKLKPGKVR